MENTEQSLEKTDDNYKVPNLEKGIAVIEYLSSRSEGETLQAIKVALDISQTTAYRILNTLVRLDYLSFDEDTKRYKLTRKLLTLGFRSLNEHNLLETVLPHLRDLRDRVKETACFGVLGDEKGIFIEQARGDHAFALSCHPANLLNCIVLRRESNHGLSAGHCPEPLSFLYDFPSLQFPYYHFARGLSGRIGEGLSTGIRFGQ